MKKTLLALAALTAFTGAASAQSNVTIYGLFNVMVTKGNGGTATNPGANITRGANDDSYALSHFATSRLGFRGTEDLGGGLSAQFQMEHRFNPDTGAANSNDAFWGARTIVQLSQAGVGSVYVGRDYTPAFWVQLKADPFANDGLAQAASGALWAGYTVPGLPAGQGWVGGVRAPNSIGFKTASFGGLTVQAAVGLSETSGIGRNQGVAIEYTAGPIWAGVALERMSGGTADGIGVTNVGASYDFGVVKAIGYYAQSRTRTAGTTNAENKNHVWMIGATAPVGPGTAKAMYYRVDPRFANNTRSKLGLGYDYPLSKRTVLYGEAALAREDQRTNNNVVGLGIRHSF